MLRKVQPPEAKRYVVLKGRVMLLTEYNEAETMELFREDGRKEGMIKQAIKMYRELIGYNDEEILAAICEEFDLSPEEAETYIAGERETA